MSSQSTTTTTTYPWLLTGVTGGLGAKILSDMLSIHNMSPKSIIATSRSESNRSKFESQGLEFRVADFADRSTLLPAFENVENLLFMSSAEPNDARRNEQHENVIAAAKEAGVRKVWYVSLAFGGWGDGSKIGFQAAHYVTEEKLVDSGLDFVSLRAGIYSDAFPLFLNWYPSSEEVLFPLVTPSVEQSKIAWTTRDELGEGMATLFAKGLGAFTSIQPKTKKNIILLTAMEANSLTDLVGAINRGRETNIPSKHLEPNKWIEESTKDDIGGKGKGWFEARLGFVEGVCNGDAEVTDSALQVLLERNPETGIQSVERMVREDRNYTWHQNHAR